MDSRALSCQWSRLFEVEKMAQRGISRNALFLLFHNLNNLPLDAVVVCLYRRLHTFPFRRGVFEISDYRQRVIGFCFRRNTLVVNNNLGMENLLVYPFIKVIRHRSDKYALRQRGYFARRYQ